MVRADHRTYATPDTKIVPDNCWDNVCWHWITSNVKECTGTYFPIRLIKDGFSAALMQIFYRFSLFRLLLHGRHRKMKRDDYVSHDYSVPGQCTLCLNNLFDYKWSGYYDYTCQWKHQKYLILNMNFHEIWSRIQCIFYWISLSVCW